MFLNSLKAHHADTNVDLQYISEWIMNPSCCQMKLNETRFIIVCGIRFQLCVMWKAEASSGWFIVGYSNLCKARYFAIILSGLDSQSSKKETSLTLQSCWLFEVSNAKVLMNRSYCILIWIFNTSLFPQQMAFCKIESRMSLLWETFPSASGIGWPSFL